MLVKKRIMILVCSIVCLFYFLMNEQTEHENDKKVVKESGMKDSFRKEELFQEEMIGEEAIHLLLTASNQIVDLPLEEYLKGVVLAEMPIEFEMEALKAQAIVARTYTRYKMKHHSFGHENADICDNIQCCQAYQTKENAFLSWNDDVKMAKWQKIEEAVQSTCGELITYQGEVIEAFFHSHSAGQTEDVKYLWNEEEIPYLKSVSGMEQTPFLETKSFDKQEFKKLIAESVPQYDVKRDRLQIVDYTQSGRVWHVKMGKTIIKAMDLRAMLGLRSTKFQVEENEQTITFRTSGYGHGVGMSQYGGNQMAKNGASAEQIIQHYYSGVMIERKV